MTVERTNRMKEAAMIATNASSENIKMKLGKEEIIVFEYFILKSFKSE